MMDRRGFFKLFGMGAAAVIAERVFPFRVYSFPSPQTYTTPLCIFGPPPLTANDLRRTVGYIQSRIGRDFPDHGYVHPAQEIALKKLSLTELNSGLTIAGLPVYVQDWVPKDSIALCRYVPMTWEDGISSEITIEDGVITSIWRDGVRL